MLLRGSFNFRDMTTISKDEYNRVHHCNPEIFKTLQSVRRKELLIRHKHDRSTIHDSSRINLVQQIIDTDKNKCTNKNQHRYYFQRDNLILRVQEAEWMSEQLEDDIDNWYMIPYPKGKRVLIYARDNFIKVLNKYGHVKYSKLVNRFHDFHQRNRYTILDCIYNEKSNKYFILDVLAYNSHDFINCEAMFRFEWIATRMNELNNFDHPMETEDKIILCLPPRIDCSDREHMQKCLLTYPMFENDETIELDGLIFYHKEANYEIGKTSVAVLWLFPFMVPELIPGVDIHLKYKNKKPSNYSTYKNFINVYDSKANELKKKYCSNKKIKCDELGESTINMDVVESDM